MTMIAAEIYDLRVDSLPSGKMFCASRLPVFSWKFRSERRGFRQQACRIRAFSEGKLLWDSGKCPGSGSVCIPWGGEALDSRTAVTWRVTAWDEEGNELNSPEASFETSLFSNADWSARWMKFDGNNPAAPAPLPFFRREFQTEKGVVRARLYAACRGNCEVWLNGQQAGNDRMAPGWTDFRKRVQVLAWDVTALLREGKNAVGVIAADGWYCSYLSGRRRNLYGETPEVLLQLELRYADGKEEKILSGPGWKTATGPYLYSDIYDGEFYDARLEMPGWSEPGFDDAKWRPVTVGEDPADSPPLIPKMAEPVRVMHEIPARKLLHPRPEVWIWDFGQNMAGVVRIRNIRSRAGVLFTFRYGEMLNGDGTLYNLNYRSARNTDYFVPGADLDTPVSYETRFTFHGFRYVQIDGFQFCGRSAPEELEVTALALHSDLEPASDFRCGLPEVNRLYRNILWSQRSNFLEIPTDCPQRDERLGWTGDAEVFCGTAVINMNAAPFFRKYLADMRDAQRPNGAVPSVVPDILGSCGAAAWADAAVICPWTLYAASGDRRFLEDNFDMMRRWVDYVHETSHDLIRPATSFGDWLSLSPVPTPSELIGTAYFAHTAELTAKAAELIGKKAEARHYGELAAKVRAAFCAKFTGAEGVVVPETQTALALALHFQLLPEPLRARNARRLAELVRANGGRLNTGFVGTACLNLALSENGQARTACDLYLQRAFPSWLFSVDQGATTVWERWNSYTKAEGFGDVNMNSFNHYAYGAVHEWAVKHLCGLRYAAPGGAELLFAPEPDPRLKFVEVSLETPRGRAECGWRFEGSEKLLWHVAAPPNSVMHLRLPAGWRCADFSATLPCGARDFELSPALP